MKNYLLLALMFLQTSFLFAQNFGKSDGNVKQSPENVSYLSCDESRPEVRKSLSYYSEWRNVSCYSKIQYRIAAFSLGVIRGSQKNTWKIQFKNNYDKDVNVKFQLYVGNDLRIDDIIGVKAGKYWGIECAGGSGGELSESLALNYRLEIVSVKEDIRGTPTEDVENFKCDGSLISTNYSSFSSTKTNQQQTAIEQVGNVLQNQALTMTQNNLADLQNTMMLEHEVRNKLNGNESKYPQAVQYFDQYLNEKKKRKTLQWIGMGGIGIGVGAIIIGILPALKSDQGEGMKNGLVYGGIGLAAVGLTTTIITIKPSKKGKAALEKAKSYVTLGTNKNGIGFALNF